MAKTPMQPLPKKRADVRTPGDKMDMPMMGGKKKPVPMPSKKAPKC